MEKINFKSKSLAKNTGAATLELLIAFTILILNITAVVLIVNGGQSISIDSETNLEAISKAKNYLEETKITAENNYSLVISKTSTEMSGPLKYTKELKVLDLTQCKKEVTGIVSWLVSPIRPQKIELTTLLTDIAGAIMLGGDCDFDSLGDWDNPTLVASASLGGDGATDIDVRNNFIYLTSDAIATSKEDFFIYEFDPTTLTLVQKAKLNVSSGLNKVDAIKDYAFVVNTEPSNHLMVFNVSNPQSPALIASSTLPNMLSGVGRSIYYYNNFVYIGTQYLACPVCPPQQNNEFHIYDVSNPGAPDWQGSFNVNHHINDIVVRGDYAYLATSGDYEEIIILDVSNPANITQVGIFNAQDTDTASVAEDATSLYLLGNKLYFGRKRAPNTRPDFYIIDITNPASPSLVGSKNLGMSTGSVVTSIIVKENLAFVGIDSPTSGLQILDISTPTNIISHPVCSSLNFLSNSTAIDTGGDFIFSAHKISDELRVIKDQTSICP